MMYSVASTFPFPTTTATSSVTHAYTHQRQSYTSTITSPPDRTGKQWTSEESSHQGKTIRYRLSQLCREGQPQIAHRLFDTIPHPTTVIWNAMIIGFICNNMPHEAILFYSRMKHAATGSHKCDPYTYSATLKACAQTKQLRIGKALHGHILRSNIHPSRIVYNSLLNMYATCLGSSSLDPSNRDLVKRVFATMRKRNVITWNIMISWYAKTNRDVEAVQHFVLMMKVGLKPTAVSFVNVFPAVSGIGDPKIAVSLYGLVIKMGCEYINDMFVASSAIFMLAELGSLDFARKIFDHQLQRNTEVWNTMIGGYVQNDCLMEALDLFVEAMEVQENVDLDDVSFILALSAASQLQQLRVTQQLHAYMLKNSFACTVLFNAVIAAYSRCNCINESFKFFSGMQERDVVSWNTMVSALVQNGLDEEGLMLVYEMQKQGFMVDAVTFTSLLSIASNLRNHWLGKQMHAYLLRHNISSEGMETYVIDMYAKCGRMDMAQAFFQTGCTKDRDQATWNSMIAGNTQNGLIQESFLVFRQMLEQQVAPNSVTLASVLPACSQSGNISLGKQLHGFAMRRLLDKNVFVSSALVDMYSKSGAISSAEHIFLQCPDKNSVTYTNMILGYGHHGMGEKAVTLFYSLKECGVEPDTITFVAVLSACSYTGLVDEGLKIFESMEKEYGVKPSMEHYACVVDMLGRVGRVVEAYEFVKGLGEEGKLLGIWGSLLAACKIHGNFELAKAVGDELLEMNGGDRITGYHVLLSNIYAEEANWELVNSLRRGMQEKGLRKEVGCSWINISGYASSFVSRDNIHPQQFEIYEILEKLTTHLKDAGYRPSL